MLVHFVTRNGGFRMPRASRNPKDLVCTNCHKLLATSEGIKCPRCKTIHSELDRFATELKPDDYTLALLWKPDGSQAASIVIRKEVWLNTGPRDFPGIPSDQLKFPVFHLYNYLDPSTAITPTSGCRVNDPNEPFVKFQDALTMGLALEKRALQSRQWVHAHEVAEPAATRPKEGQRWSFRDLERFSREHEIGFEDLRDTLEHYSHGAAISFNAVISIIWRIRLSSDHRRELLQIATSGLNQQQHSKQKIEWSNLVKHLGGNV